MIFDQIHLDLLIGIFRFGTFSIDQGHLWIDGKTSRQMVAKRLLAMEKEGWLKHHGGVTIRGSRKVKVVYLTPKGIEILKAEEAIPLNSVVKNRSRPKFSTTFDHRLNLITLLVTIEAFIRKIRNVEVENFMVDYRMNQQKKPETLAHLKASRDEIVIPDAIVWVADHHRKKSMVFCIELDNGTEPLTSTNDTDSNKRKTIRQMFLQYQKFMEEGNVFLGHFLSTYPLTYFRVLTVTEGDGRAKNMRPLGRSLKKERRPFFSVTTLGNCLYDFNGNHWLVLSGESGQPIFKGIGG